MPEKIEGLFAEGISERQISQRLGSRGLHHQGTLTSLLWLTFFVRATRHGGEPVFRVPACAVPLGIKVESQTVRSAWHRKD
jgi:hypothetical protein